MRLQLCRALLIVLCVLSPLHAIDAPWTRGTYLQRAIGEGTVPVADLLRNFSRAQGVPIVISDDVQGTVSISYPEMPPEEYLENLTRDSGLIWYYDGAAIHVYTSGELTSEVLSVGSIGVDELIASLKRLGVYSDRFPITAEPEYGLLYVVGPKRYHEVIKQITQGADLRAQQQARVQIDVEVFPLQYAWADDQTFVIGDNQIAVPGVATILRNVLFGDTTGLQGVSVTQVPYNLQSLRGFGLIRPQNQAIANAQQAAVNAQLAAQQAQAQAQAQSQVQSQVQAALGDKAGESITQQQAEQQLAAQTQGVIQADPRLNAIIVRDVRERMEGYRRIIEQLDRPSGLIEIKASIIDLDADQGFQLGLPYHVLWEKDGRQRNFRARIDTTNQNLIDANIDPGNLTVSLMDDQVTQFFLNMQALETDGHARLVSKPSVVTINNIEAYLEETEEFYVRVSGFEQVDLFNIKVGTRLYVIPHIVEESDGRRVKLNVRIEDGSRSETAEVDEVPVVSRHTINTQAVLLEGQSLLIGGLIREEENKTVQGIPIISRIPHVGAAFRETVHSTRRVERMVLLTPTIIDLPTARTPRLAAEEQLADNVSTAPEPAGVIQTSRTQTEVKLRPMSAMARDPSGKLTDSSAGRMPISPAKVQSPADQKSVDSAGREQSSEKQAETRQRPVPTLSAKTPIGRVRNKAVAESGRDERTDRTTERPAARDQAIPTLSTQTPIRPMPAGSGSPSDRWSPAAKSRTSRQQPSVPPLSSETPVRPIRERSQTKTLQQNAANRQSTTAQQRAVPVLTAETPIRRPSEGKIAEPGSHGRSKNPTAGQDQIPTLSSNTPINRIAAGRRNLVRGEPTEPSSTGWQSTETSTVPSETRPEVLVREAGFETSVQQADTIHQAAGNLQTVESVGETNGAAGPAGRARIDLARPLDPATGAADGPVGITGEQERGRFRSAFEGSLQRFKDFKPRLPGNWLRLRAKPPAPQITPEEFLWSDE